MEEVILALLKNFLQLTRASVFGNAVLDLKAKILLDGACIADFYILILFNKCWDFVLGEILQPWWNNNSDTNEELKTGMVTERERWTNTGNASNEDR